MISQWAATQSGAFFIHQLWWTIVVYQLHLFLGAHQLHNICVPYLCIDGAWINNFKGLEGLFSSKVLASFFYNWVVDSHGLAHACFQSLATERNETLQWETSWYECNLLSHHVNFVSCSYFCGAVSRWLLILWEIHCTALYQSIGHEHSLIMLHNGFWENFLWPKWVGKKESY